MYNNVTLMGRIATAPTIKTTKTDVKYATFRIAVDRHYRTKDGKRVTDFLNVIAWRKTAEFICEHFSKGRLILIDGELQTRGYSDNNGNIQSWTEVVANRVSFTGERSDDTRRDDKEIPPPLMPPGDGERYIFDDDYLEY